MNRQFAIATMVLSAVSPAALGAAHVFTGTGTDAQVTAAINTFRNALGPLNANVPGSFGTGRREINWDDVPDSAATPNLFPPDFYNANIPGRARGVKLESLGTGFQVSADSNNPTNTPTNFANLNPQFGTLFRPFSGERLFAPVGTLSLISFFVPGTNVPATVSGFGVVFSDVDVPDESALTFLGPDGQELLTVRPPAATTATGGASFVGVLFDAGERVAHVAIISGNVPLDGSQSERLDTFEDAVAMDDFIFGEPVARLVGDTNGDGHIDAGDVQRFVTCMLLHGVFCGIADMNSDGVVNSNDVPLFVRALLTQ